MKPAVIVQHTLCLALSLTPALRAQAPASTTADPAAEVQRSYTTLKTNILKAADTMPADAYTFRPTPDIRTFARVVNHVTEAQLHSCGALNQTAPQNLPKIPPETADKPTIIAALQSSFSECDKAYAALSAATLFTPVTAGPVTRSRNSVAWGNVSHDNEQYATLALYLRLKGLLPPTSEK